MNGGKTVYVSNSTTPKSERLTDIRPKPQWKNIDWKKVIKSINRLQTRITKARRKMASGKKTTIFNNSLVLCEIVSCENDMSE
jgi:hypothetical protein